MDKRIISVKKVSAIICTGKRIKEVKIGIIDEAILRRK